MNVFSLPELLEERRRSDRRYLEFLRVPALSAGLYVLPAGAADTQTPHAQDEIYYVVRGSGIVRIGRQDHPVGPGSFIYVKAREPHCFHSITAELTLLVVFAPAETSEP